MDYRSLFDRDYIGAWDLGGKDVTVLIAKVDPGELTAQGGKKSHKPIIRFEGKEKAFIANKTNCRIIAGLYGNDVTKWVGKKITIFPTTTSMGSDTVDCIRVRNRIPAAEEKKQEASPNGSA